MLMAQSFHLMYLIINLAHLIYYSLVFSPKQGWRRRQGLSK